MTWHIHPDTLIEYANGSLDPVRVMAVEAHVSVCPACRLALPADDQWLTRSWSDVLDVVDAPRRGALERLSHRIGLSEHRARLLMAAPALRLAWLSATAAVLSFAVLAAYVVDGTDSRALLAFLIVAPVLPVLTVAAAYGPRVDPLHEIAATTPTAGPVLVLWRTTAVLASSMGMGILTALLLPAPGWLAAAWLLPALSLCLGGLALATAMSLQVAAGLLGTGWLTVVTVVALADDPRLAGAVVTERLFGPYAQIVYLTAVLLAAVVLTVRRRRLDPGEPR